VTGLGPTVAELGERELLARILDRLPKVELPLGPGDDSAILEVPDGRVVVTSDTMIEGPDFRLDWSSPHDLGVKAMVSNLSDLAAMGARPTGIVVALALPGSTEAAFVERLAEGMTDALRAHAPCCAIAGGDLATAPQLMIAVTAFGSLDGRDPALRSGARPGDVLAVSGPLGHAAAGLRLLLDGLQESRDAEAQRLIAAQLAPNPDLTAGVRAVQAGVTAMMDLSDGPLLDADRLAKASGVVVDLEPRRFAHLTDRLAHHPARLLGLRPLESVHLALELQLSGGEEHSMLATFPEGTKLPHGFTRIGAVREAAGDDFGVSVSGSPATPRGWDPYRDASSTSR
jgi:thiamine-monophosphate kinase